MAGRHDDDIVLRPDRHIFAGVQIITENDLPGLRIDLRPCKIGAVVEHCHMEADLCQHWHERLADMAAAEDIDASRTADRLHIQRRLARMISRTRQQHGPQLVLRNTCQEPQSVLLIIKAHLRRLILRHSHHEPAVFRAGEHFQHRIHRRKLFRRQKLIVNRDIAAADHTDVADLIGREAERAAERSPLAQKLLRLLRRDALDRAAADGARRVSVGKNGHLRACAARRRAGGCEDRTQNCIFSAGQRRADFFKKLFHGRVLLILV